MFSGEEGVASRRMCGVQRQEETLKVLVLFCIGCSARLPLAVKGGVRRTSSPNCREYVTAHIQYCTQRRPCMRLIIMLEGALDKM